MSRVDPKALIGKRVFIETDKEDYIGTLKIIRDYALELEDYYQVHKHDGEKIIAHGMCGSYTKIIMHSGGSKEMMSIKLNTLKGDLFAPSKSDDEGSDDDDDDDGMPWLSPLSGGYCGGIGM